MLTTAAWLLVLASASSDADADATASVLAWLDFGRELNLGPCSTVFPDQGERFAREVAAWRAANAEAIARGRDYNRRMLAENAGGNAETADADPDGVTDVLREMPPADGLALCGQLLGLEPVPRQDE